MNATEFETALRNNDRRRVRALLVCFVVLLVAGGFGGVLAKREADRARAAEMSAMLDAQAKALAAWGAQMQAEGAGRAAPVDVDIDESIARTAQMAADAAERNARSKAR